MPPRGIFGHPHGILSSPDEVIAFGIGVLAVVIALAYDRFSDGTLDLRPVSRTAVVGVFVGLLGSALAPPIVTDEWHIPVVVVGLFIAVGAAVVEYRRRRRNA